MIEVKIYISRSIAFFLFRYTHAKKVWDFLRYDRSNKLVSENDNGINKADQQPTSPLPTFGPVPLFKWPDIKIDSPEESMLFNQNVIKNFLDFI